MVSLASDPLGPGHAAALAAGVDPSDLAGRHVLRFCSPLLATLANCLGNTCFTPKRAVQCLPLFLSLLLLLPSPVLRVLCLPVNACVPSVCHRRAAPHSPLSYQGRARAGSRGPQAPWPRRSTCSARPVPSSTFPWCTPPLVPYEHIEKHETPNHKSPPRASALNLRKYQGYGRCVNF